MQAYVLLIIKFVTGPIYDREYVRTLLLVGISGVIFGDKRRTSVCTNYYSFNIDGSFCLSLSLFGLGSRCYLIFDADYIAYASQQRWAIT
jgi:hypothetical protein